MVGFVEEAVLISIRIFGPIAAQRPSLKKSFYGIEPSNDNPNYIIQVGNVFGFIISIENPLLSPCDISAASFRTPNYTIFLCFCGYFVTSTNLRRIIKDRLTLGVGRSTL